MKRYALIGLAEDGNTEIVLGEREQDEPPADAEVVPHEPAEELDGKVGAFDPSAVQAPRTEMRGGVKPLANGRPSLRPLIDEQPALQWWQVISGRDYADFIIAADQVTAVYRVASIPLKAAKERRKDEVDAMLANRAAVGVALPGTGGKAVQLRPQDQPNITAMAAQAMLAKSGGATWDPAFKWRLADNTFAAISTPDAMLAMANAAAAAVVSVRKVAWNHKDAIEALGTAEAVAAYDIGAGW
jgi:hypothetical protein